MRRLVFVVISLCFVLLFSGCEQVNNILGIKKEPKKSSLKAKSKISPSGAAARTPSSPSKQPGNLLAQVGGWTLTLEDFNKEIEAIININKGKKEIPVDSLGILARTIIPSYIDKLNFDSPEGKKIYLDFLVNLELFAQEAESRGMDKNPDIAKSLRANAVEILDFALLNSLLKNITVTPLEIENFYNNEYKKTLENIEQRKVREIVVNSQERAKDILVEILRGGSFAGIASANSIAQSAKNGGDLGYLVYSPEVKFTKFWETVLTLDRGQISSIFKDPQKEEYYLVMVEDIKKGQPESLNKIFDQLELILKQKKSFEAIDNLIKDTKSKLSPVVDHNLIK